MSGFRASEVFNRWDELVEMWCPVTHIGEVFYATCPYPGSTALAKLTVGQTGLGPSFLS